VVSEKFGENPVTHFIEEWLNHLNLPYEVNSIFPEMAYDYYLPSQSIAILNSKWKKPISVQYLNKIITDMEESQIKKVYLIAKKFSTFCIETIDRLELNIKTLDPNCLSELAIEIFELNRQEYTPRTILSTG